MEDSQHELMTAVVKIIPSVKEQHGKALISEIPYVIISDVEILMMKGKVEWSLHLNVTSTYHNRIRKHVLIGMVVVHFKSKFWGRKVVGGF